MTPRNIVPMPARRAPRPEPVFVEHEPVISHEHRNEARRWNRVPYPYRLGKMDGAWLLVSFLAAGGFAFKWLWLIAGFIAAMRVLVYLCFRFPMTMIFFTALINGLMGGRRGRRW